MLVARRSIPLVFALVACTFVAPPARASFHLMQIEQAIGGVNGDISAQAIQLRMRSFGENLVYQARIRAWDAAGLNPVLIVDMTAAVANGFQGDHVLITSSTFQSNVSSVLAPDFTMTNLIPDSYLAAGSLTFESDFGFVVWRLSWGGAGYTGTGMVGATSIYNDADGNANPPFAGPLPSTTAQALVFAGASGALSTNNAADYSVTSGVSVWTNNAGTAVAGVENSPGVSGVQLGAPSPNPVTGALSYSVSLARLAHVRVAVYAVGGQRVRTLLDRELSAGRHDFGWDARSEGGSRLASGVYYLALESEGVRQSRKFAVIR